ncbi:helix-turn-helix transcriptional regulator [Nonomuraea sp. NPDC048882]|uniref:helix-turn-helix domain-containing protein n=1 Tax=unclassified Nonomuraea TaxID=2593643 RepID=UPI0033D8B66A
MTTDRLSVATKNGHHGHIGGADNALGKEIRRRREAEGMSLADLAQRIHYSKGYLSKVETGRAHCSPALAQACDKAFGADGKLAALVAEGSAGDRPERPSTVYGLEFLAALDAAHKALREVAGTEPHDPDDHAARANRAVHEAGLYLARERLLVSGTVLMVTSGEEAFLRLVAIRDTIRAGAKLESPQYHEAYHRYAEALWSFRMEMRAEFGQPPLLPELLNLTDWSDRERCRRCAGTS